MFPWQTETWCTHSSSSGIFRKTLFRATAWAEPWEEPRAKKHLYYFFTSSRIDVRFVVTVRNAPERGRGGSGPSERKS